MEDSNFRKGDAKTAIFGSEKMLQASPVDKIPDGPTTPEIAYQMVKDETFAQTQPRLNLATFVTTYMDDYATKLMNEAININYIDETEYPRIAVMNAKCINIVANLWNTPEQAKWKAGALAIGSSEACMLGGVAAWLRWRKKRQAAGKPVDKPNFVISTGFQVVWEKFAQLWQIEMRQVPLTLEKTTLDPEEALKMCDENTICIVPIQGVTWTGLNDDVEALDKALDAYNAKTGYDIPIHVDAASGGFILPFLKPELKWDFRLKWVLSISTSGHKFGLVYPGLGWVVWKDKSYLPDSMSFSVNYLGANITQVGLNFSRPAAQILGQYYQFIRLGFEGYKAVHASIASAGNSYRLGANEAPPAILSIFLGKQLSSILDEIARQVSNSKMTAEEKTTLKLGIGRIPEILLDTTDRNRTSPFAFTGNRFEFRAAGSSANCAAAMIAINAAMANQLNEFKVSIEKLMEEGVGKDEAIFRILKETIIASEPIRFEGDGYSEQWKQEAAKRGLTNICHVPAGWKLRRKQVFLLLKFHRVESNHSAHL